jgi:hypothetical protein
LWPGYVWNIFSHIPGHKLVTRENWENWDKLNVYFSIAVLVNFIIQKFVSVFSGDGFFEETSEYILHIFRACAYCQKVSLITIGEIFVKIQFCAVAKECFTIEQPCRGLMDANIREITLDIRLDPLENPTRDLMNRVQFDRILFLFFYFKIPVHIVITSVNIFTLLLYHKAGKFNQMWI